MRHAGLIFGGPLDAPCGFRDGLVARAFLGHGGMRAPLSDGLDADHPRVVVVVGCYLA